ncbi:HD domain-containing protein [Pseudodesulfovibrio cashew]|uniref:HD domain-containing protein n=1 Tax=Pseudodesulfovibrio cashew TaxID=2678688 RepID=A0A6I6JIY7_9BACT|nr:HD domain-containing phosphohydrolase [Pseudodesulfovibrio cashew]QGY40137.1 HD domain-containing protein [Pseudodesulfovibrio cashew]
MVPKRSKPQYVSISPLMLRADSRVPFDVFLRHEGNYVLFNAAGMTLTGGQCRELAANSVNNVYIDKRSLDSYRTYLNEYITGILDDEGIPLDKRAEAWSNAAAMLGKELYEDKLPGPTFEKRYHRFEQLITSTAGFIQSPKPLKHLSGFISKGYNIYHHGISTMVYSMALMHEFGYQDFKILSCGMGALLHDIGKIGLPQDIVTKDPAELSGDEAAVLQLHPMVGARTCSCFNLSSIASNCILFHHERADGKGYPTKAGSEDIPQYVQIICLCNAYDTLTRNMPYRKALRPFEALKTIMDDDGMVEKPLLKRFVEMLSRAEIM